MTKSTKQNSNGSPLVVVNKAIDLARQLAKSHRCKMSVVRTELDGICVLSRNTTKDDRFNIIEEIYNTEDGFLTANYPGEKSTTIIQA